MRLPDEVQAGESGGQRGGQRCGGRGSERGWLVAQGEVANFLELFKQPEIAQSFREEEPPPPPPPPPMPQKAVYSDGSGY